MAASLMMAVAVWADPPAWQAVFRAIVRRIGELTGGRCRWSRRRLWSRRSKQVRGASAGAGVPRSRKRQPSRHRQWMPLRDRWRSRRLCRKKKWRRWQGETEAAVGRAAVGAEGAGQAVADDRRAIGRVVAGAKDSSGRPGSDAEFMRRVYLDLTGRIPSVSEVQEFLEDQSPDRREKLVDRLLAHRDHATHLAAVWRADFVAGRRRFEPLWRRGEIRGVAGRAIRGQRAVRPDRARSAAGRGARVGVGAAVVLCGAAAEPGRAGGADVAGVPGRADGMCPVPRSSASTEFISQHDFWSFAAFFARISRPRGKMEMTSPVLAVRDNQQGDVTIPDSDEVVPPRLPLTAVELEDTADGPSRREQLVDWLTSPNNGQFARATVNRVWAHLFGRGLVEPVDDMRPANAPIAPEVLDTLSRDFAASGFDLRRLLRALVLTKRISFPAGRRKSDPSRTLLLRADEHEELYGRAALRLHRRGDAAGRHGRRADERGRADAIRRHEPAGVYRAVPRAGRAR